jgi:hypothetical protein
MRCTRKAEVQGRSRAVPALGSPCRQMIAHSRGRPVIGSAARRSSALFTADECFSRVAIGAAPRRASGAPDLQPCIAPASLGGASLSLLANSRCAARSGSRVAFALTRASGRRRSWLVAFGWCSIRKGRDADMVTASCERIPALVARRCALREPSSRTCRPKPSDSERDPARAGSRAAVSRGRDPR